MVTGKRHKADQYIASANNGIDIKRHYKMLRLNIFCNNDSNNILCLCIHNGFSIFYKNGLSIKVIYFFLICLVIIPNNFMWMIMLLKDTPYSILLLWLTFLFLKIYQKEKNYFFKFSNKINLIIALFGVYAFRHNGIGPLIFCGAFLIFFSLQKKILAPITLFGMTILLILFFNGPVFRLFDIKKVDFYGGSSYLTGNVIRAAGNILQNGWVLSVNTEKILCKEISPELIRKYYDRFDCDKYTYHAEIYNYKASLNKQDAIISNKEAIVSYLDMFVHYPYLTIKERFGWGEFVMGCYTAVEWF